MNTKVTLAFLAVLLSGNIVAQNTFPSSGNAGVGTTTPIAPLTVNGVMAVTGGAYSELPGDNKIQLVSGYTPADKTSGRIFYGDGTGWSLNFATKAAGGPIMDRIMVKDNGNIGLGVYNPVNKLSFPDLSLSNDPNGIAWWPGSATMYAIHRTDGPWTSPDYQQIRVGWPTGIILDPGDQYGKSYVDVKGGGIKVSTINGTGGNLGLGVYNPISNITLPDPSSSTGTIGIAWNNSTTEQYSLCKTAGSWTAPDYQQLRMTWQTGIILDPGYQYGKSYVEIPRGGLKVSQIRGNLGINVTNPVATLTLPDLTSADPIGIAWNNSTAEKFSIHKTAGSWTAPDYQQLRMAWETGIVLDPGYQYGKSYVDIKGSGMRVTSGSVGIGTTTPDANAKLDVNGNIFTSGKIAIGETNIAKIGNYSLAVNGEAIFTKARLNSITTGPIMCLMATTHSCR